MRRRRAVVTFTCLSIAATSGAAFAATSGVAGATPVNQSTGFYTVQSGDTLGAIAAAAGTDYQTLAQINNLADPNVIVAGQVLILDPATAQVFTSWIDGVLAAGGQPAQQAAAAPVEAAAPAPAPDPSTTSSSSSSSSGSVSSDSTASTGSSSSGIASCIRQAENGGSYGWGTGDGGGAYQFEPGTWAYVNSQDGGSTSDTSQANQDAAFNWLYSHDGSSPWAGDPCVG